MLKLRATRLPAQLQLNDISCAPAHNTPLPLERSAPASFKRLLGSNGKGARKSVAALPAYKAARSDDTRCKRQDDEKRIKQEKVDADVALSSAQPTAVHGVLIGGVQKPGDGRGRCQFAAREAIQPQEEGSWDQSEPWLGDEDRPEDTEDRQRASRDWSDGCCLTDRA